jgi:hypothetical protein
MPQGRKPIFLLQAQDTSREEHVLHACRKVARSQDILTQWATTRTSTCNLMQVPFSIHVICNTLAVGSRFSMTNTKHVQM